MLFDCLLAGLRSVSYTKRLIWYLKDMKYFITAKNIFIEKVSPKSIHVLRSSYLYPFTSLRPMLSNYHSSLIPQNLVCEIVTFPSNGEKRYMVGENCSLISMSVKFNVKHLKSICTIFIIRRCRQ